MSKVGATCTCGYSVESSSECNFVHAIKAVIEATDKLNAVCNPNVFRVQSFLWHYC